MWIAWEIRLVVSYAIYLGEWRILLARLEILSQVTQATREIKGHMKESSSPYVLA